MNIEKTLAMIQRLIVDRSPQIYSQGDLVAALRKKHLKRHVNHGEVVNLCEGFQKQIAKLQMEVAHLQAKKK